MDSHHESRPTPSPYGEILLYQTADGRARVQCRFVDKTLWLSQALIAELYGVTVPTVNEHLKAIYDSGELSRNPTVRSFLIVRQEVSREVERSIEHYNLDVILAVGYRVCSARGVQFRRWATDRLREYLVKGFTMDDERLKNPPAKGLEAPDYFDELLSRIRDIRTSERLRNYELLLGTKDLEGQTLRTNARETSWPLHQRRHPTSRRQFDL